MTYYILNTLTIKYGRIEQLSKTMKEFLPYMESQGWHLRGAYQPVIGNFNKITHLWEIDDLECLNKMLSGVGSDPHVLKTISTFTEFLESEELQMVVKTPYSP
jgi:NIPSNAP